MRSSRPGSAYEELHSSRGFSAQPTGVGGSEDRPPGQLSLPDRARTPICLGLHSFSSSVADQPHRTTVHLVANQHAAPMLVIGFGAGAVRIDGGAVGQRRTEGVKRHGF